MWSQLATLYSALESCWESRSEMLSLHKQGRVCEVTDISGLIGASLHNTYVYQNTTVMP